MSSSTTSKEAFELHARAFKTIHKQCPQLFASLFTNAVFTAVTPYAGIYLSAKIINELAGSRRPQELWKLVIITVAVTSVLSLLTYITERWEGVRAGTC